MARIDTTSFFLSRVGIARLPDDIVFFIILKLNLWHCWANTDDHDDDDDDVDGCYTFLLSCRVFFLSPLSSFAREQQRGWPMCSVIFHALKPISVSAIENDAELDVSANCYK